MTGGREPLGTTLSNGLRVLVAPWPGTPRVAVAVHYRVGFRAEPPGRQGFAHLFEHLMFRGSASLPDGRFFDHVYRLAGTANGTTHQDFTDYYQVLPSAGLEQALFAEADRMRAPRFTPRNLAEQLAGIEEEIRQATVERPYGGFPWLDMPQHANTNWYNAHNFYGDLEHLDAATLGDVQQFFKTYYALNNAALVVSGRAGFELVQKAVAAGVGCLIAVGAPTSLSVDLAKQSGLALFGFTSERRTVRYS